MSATDVLRSRRYMEQYIEGIQAASQHICVVGEYDEDGVPCIVNPQESTTYYVPLNNGGANDEYSEWGYLNGKWEKRGGIEAGKYVTQSQMDAYVAEAVQDKIEEISFILDLGGA